jgi:hypothetical protein
MKKTNFLHIALPLALAASLLTAGCSKKNSQQANEVPQQYPAQGTTAPPASQTGPSSNSAPAQSAAAAPVQAPSSAPPPPPQPVNYTIPRGTHIRITTNRELGSKISQSGETFTASVADPIVVGGRTLVRAGSRASGTVIVAKSLGRFKGQAELALRLDTIRSGGDTYNVRTSTIERVEKGKGKRTAVRRSGGRRRGYRRRCIYRKQGDRHSCRGPLDFPVGAFSDSYTLKHYLNKAKRVPAAPSLPF